ncbi:MAG TPA: hypothetical protein PJ982_17190, partial [Lacipirellulaceae bacterium]|nr:hypothetical protein [Lacipirellulaceae bacterium]
MVAALENECPRASAVGFAGRSPARAIVVALCVAAVSRHWAQAHEDLVVQYNRDIRPILSDNCFACHGFDKASREADLRLDEAESALADRGGYAAIVPHDAESSEVWRRIASGAALRT